MKLENSHTVTSVCLCIVLREYTLVCKFKAEKNYFHEISDNETILPKAQKYHCNDFVFSSK